MATLLTVMRKSNNSLIYLIPFRANKAKLIMGVYFDLNDKAAKIGKAFNTRRNTRFK